MNTHEMTACYAVKHQNITDTQMVKILKQVWQ